MRQPLSAIQGMHNMRPHCRTSSWQAWEIRSCVRSAHWSNGTSRDPWRSGKERQQTTKKTKNGSSCPRCFTIWRACRGALFKRHWQPVRIRLCKRYCSNYSTCYGCKGRVRNKPSAPPPPPPPPPPHDLLIRHLEICVYNRPGETKL